MEVPSTTPALLAAVQAAQAQFKRRQQPPLSETAREAFKNRVADTLSYALPQAYLDLLAVTDGLDWNGAVLYASETRLRDDDELDIQGLLEANIQLRLAYTPDKDFIYFAESGMDAYRHNLTTDKFEISDRVVGDSVFETFDTAEALFQQLLRNMLHVGDDDDDDDADF
ncbi:MAG TPA: YrhA family protein [Hymenobacter sp.]|jgi:hypothetical protein